MNDKERLQMIAPYQTIIDASEYIVVLDRLKGNVLPHFIRKMETYRLPLFRIAAENGLLSDIAKYTLESLNAGIKWQKTRDKADYERMIQAYKDSDIAVERVRKEVAK